MRRFAGEPLKDEPLVARMRGWTAVPDHPGFAASADTGRRRIDEMPPRALRVPASHEGEVAVEFELT